MLKNLKFLYELEKLKRVLLVIRKKTDALIEETKSRP